MRGSARASSPLWAALVAVASHATALSGGYVWLDHAHLEERLALAPPGAPWSLFTEGFAGTGFYRPLMALSLTFDTAISSRPAYLHAVTLGWHTAASALLVVAARALGASSRASLAAGLLFAAHPATSLVASAIAFRSEAIILCCLLALVVCHLKRRPFLAASALAAGALTKETAWLLAPLFIGALELTNEHGKSRTPEEKRAGRRLLLAEGLAFSAVTALRLLYAPAFRATFPALSWDEQLGSRLAALGKGALYLLLPFPNRFCDAFPATSTLAPLALLGVALLFLLAVTRFPSRRPLWLLLLALLPSLQLVPIMRWWSPHYFYIPLALSAVLVAQLAERRLKPLWPVLALALPLYGTLSLVDGRRYRDDTLLWAPEVARQPACREGHFYLGEVARVAGDWQTAALHYQGAARVLPGILAYADERAVYQNLGAVELKAGHFSEARAAFGEALERTHDREQRRRLLYDSALAALRSAEPSEAARLLAPEAQAHDPMPEGLLVRARALHELGREDEARQMLRLLASVAPNRVALQRASP
jgi:tetratricopeptide (TPR) repeat protein